MTISEVFSSSFLAIRYRLARPRARAAARAAGDGEGLLGRLLALALPVSASAVAGSLLHAANVVLVPRLLTASGMAPDKAVSALGVLAGMAMPLFMLPMSFIGPLVTVALPRLSESAALNRPADVQRRAGKALHATALIALPALFALAPAGPLLCRLLFAQDLPLPYFLWLAGASVFTYYQAVTGGVMNGIGLQRRAMVDSILGGVLQIAITWLTVPNPAFGIYGFMLGMAAGSALTVGLNLRILAGRGNIRIRWARWFAMPLLAAMATGLAVANAVILADALALPDLAAVVCSGAAGACLFLLCLRLQGIFPGKYVKELLSSVKLSSFRNTVSTSFF